MKSKAVFSLVSFFAALLLASCGGNPDPVTKTKTAPAPSPLEPRRPAVESGGSAAERQFAALISSHPKQKRQSMLWDSRLHAAAHAHARDMAERDFFDHVNPDRHGPNWRVTRTGYRLPLEWTAFKASNQVESILAGYEQPAVAFEKWLDSKKHRAHMLGLLSTYQTQSRFGVARVSVPGSTYRHYWVFISAPPES